MEIKTMIIISFGIAIIFLGSFYYFYPNEIEVEKIVEIHQEEKAQVVTSFSEWGGEIGKQNGYIFTYWIHNFGEVEAKDVVVDCVVIDQNDNIIKRISKNFGNLASNSMEYDEMYTNIIVDTTDLNAYCLTKSCTNCEILEKKIPDINKYLE